MRRTIKKKKPEKNDIDQDFNFDKEELDSVDIEKIESKSDEELMLGKAESWVNMEKDNKYQKNDIYTLDYLEDLRLGSSRPIFRLTALKIYLKSAELHLYDGFDFKIRVKDRMKREKQASPGGQIVQLNERKNETNPKHNNN